MQLPTIRMVGEAGKTKKIGVNLLEKMPIFNNNVKHTFKRQNGFHAHT